MTPIVASVSVRAGFFFPAFMANPWLITMGIMHPDGQPSYVVAFLHIKLADKANGVFKSVNKDRRPDTLVEKEYGEGWYVGELFRKFR